MATTLSYMRHEFKHDLGLTVSVHLIRPRKRRRNISNMLKVWPPYYDTILCKDNR